MPPMNYTNDIEALRESFRNIYGSDTGTLIARAPGRVNLIGEHTDYNDGFVLPVAVDKSIFICFRPNDSKQINLHTTTLNDSVTLSLVEPRTDPAHPWSRYPVSVLKVLLEEKWDLVGIDAVIASTVPPGGGLASSGAFEVCFCLAITRASGVELNPLAIAQLCQLAESRFAGLQCGIMDQFTSLYGVQDMALFLDCRSLAYELIPFPSDRSAIIVCDTGVRHELASSEYNKRRSECEAAVEMLKPFVGGIRALRDVNLYVFKTHEANLPSPNRQRARHVITENRRVEEAVKALKAKNLFQFGILMEASHASLRDDYEVSCRELDVMVEIAQSIKGVYGARMTGGGFGGCTVNLVEPGAVDRFIETITSQYAARVGLRPKIHICKIADGAGVIEA